MSFQTDVDSLLNEPFRNIIVNLYGRWLDERAYEDINEYGEFLKKHLPPKMTMLKMTKRPFGFAFTYQGRPGKEYAFFIKSTSIGWKRTK